MGNSSFLKKFYLIVFPLFFVIGFFVFDKSFAQNDFLQKIFEPANTAGGSLIYLGTNKDQVGNEILRESTVIGISLSEGLDVSKREPLIVRLAKILLRFTVVFAVAMVLYNGVLYIVQSAKGEAPKDPKKNLINILIGILLALSSLGIINLISSISYSTLKTNDDFGYINKGNNYLGKTYYEKNGLNGNIKIIVYQNINGFIFI